MGRYERDNPETGVGIGLNVKETIPIQDSEALSTDRGLSKGEEIGVISKCG